MDWVTRPKERKTYCHDRYDAHQRRKALANGEATDFDWGTIGPRSWAAFAYLVLFDSLAGFALFNWLVRHASIEYVSSYSYIVPVVAYAVGVVLLDEPFSLIVMLGSAIVITVVALEASASRLAAP